MKMLVFSDCKEFFRIPDYLIMNITKVYYQVCDQSSNKKEQYPFRINF